MTPDTSSFVSVGELVSQIFAREGVRAVPCVRGGEASHCTPSRAATRTPPPSSDTDHILLELRDDIRRSVGESCGLTAFLRKFAASFLVGVTHQQGGFMSSASFAEYQTQYPVSKSQWCSSRTASLGDRWRQRTRLGAQNDLTLALVKARISAHLTSGVVRHVSFVLPSAQQKLRDNICPRCLHIRTLLL